MSVAIEGLRRAYLNLPDDYRQLAKIVRKHLRDYIPSIYLLKRAEKRIREMEMAVRKEGTGGKRVLTEQERVGFEDRRSPSKLAQ